MGRSSQPARSGGTWSSELAPPLADPVELARALLEREPGQQIVIRVAGDDDVDLAVTELSCAIAHLNAAGFVLDYAVAKGEHGGRTLVVTLVKSPEFAIPAWN